jgi:ACS family tartrate transporter-like MFS transporter
LFATKRLGEEIMTSGSLPSAVPIDIGAETMRRVSMRLVPFLMICYIIAYIDRVNAGFAALQMNQHLGLTAAMFGFGATLFYIAYTVFEVPSNVLMAKVGPRLWIARIMLTWGLCGIAAAFATGPYSFYATRFLLGAAEAGFFPGAVFYLTLWFPIAYRSRVMAAFGVAVPLSVFVGAPISGALLHLDGMLGFRGWQWLFIMESIPAILLGLGALFMLPDRPAEAKWLTPEQRDWLTRQLEAEQHVKKPVGHMSLWQVLTNKYVLLLGVVYAGASATSNSLSLWMPQILKSFQLSNLETSLLGAIPYGLACVAMIIWSRRADRSGERVWNTALPLALTAASLAAMTLSGSVWIMLALLSLALMANYSIKGPFWALVTSWLSTGSAAAGIAAINTLAHIGTSITTTLIGVIRDKTGSFPVALLPLAFLTAIGAVTVVLLAQSQNRSEAALAPSPAE